MLLTNFRKYIAEFIGTYALVFCGTGAIVINDVSGGVVSHVGIAITFGAIVLAMIYTFGETSGAHINPAVTLAFWVSGTFPKQMILPYALSQILGAITASFTLLFLFPESGTLGETLPSGSLMQSFILELILTFFLMLVIIHVASGSKEQGLMAGIAIGTVVMLEAMFAGPICGASMNPARSIGPALASGNIQHLWAYIVAPTLGALLAVLAWRIVKPINNNQ